jgi:hypothetical protein
MHFLKSLVYLLGFFLVAAFAREQTPALQSKTPAKA